MKDSLTIRLGATLARALKDASKQTGLSQGEIARQALQARLREPARLSVMKSYFATARGPRDLSTNKAYRRNWKRSGT